MDFTHRRLPFLSLEDEYTYLQQIQKRKPNPLLSLSEELNQMKKLPLIERKQLKTSRKPNKQLLNLKQTTNPYRKQPNPLSEHRYPRPQVMPIYIPLPISIPIHMQYTPQVLVSPDNNSQVKPASKQIPLNDPDQQEPTVIKTEQVQRKIKEINKFPQRSRRNRFRIVAYAVYFSIYFKYFSRKFTQLRRNWFSQRYALNDGRVIAESSMKILKHLQEVDIYKMLQTAKQKAKDITLQENVDKAWTSKGSTPVATLMNFVSLLMEYARQYMTEESFIKEHHEVFTVGVLNQNFMLSNLYLPQEAAILHIHPQGYILVGQQTEIILLMLKIVVKIIVYNFLLGLKFSRHWNSKQEKSYGLDDSDMEELWAITRNSGIFLTVVCEQIYDRAYKQMQDPLFSYNFKEVSPKFNILPAKSLEELKISKIVLHPNDSNSKLILNLQGYHDMRMLIDQSPPLKKFKEVIKFKIIDFLTTIYTYLKFEEARVYDFCRLLTLDEKYLILKGKKQDLIAKNKKRKKKHKQIEERYDQNGNKIKKKPPIGPSAEHEDDKSSGDEEIRRQGLIRSSKILKSGDYESSECDSDDKQQPGGQLKGGRKKKLRFKHEQAFFDHKFEGCYKLEKLKKKMAK